MKIGVIGIPGGRSSEELASACSEHSGEKILVDIEKCVTDFSARTIRSGSLDLATCDALIIKKISTNYSPEVIDRLHLLAMLQTREVRIFSQPERIATAVNRLTCTRILRQGNIPMPETIIVEEIEAAISAVSTFGEVVMKPLFSTKARGMKICPVDFTLRGELESFKHAGNQMLYLQKKVDIPGRDLGIVFLGGEYLASYARVAGTGSWNTTIHSGGRYAPVQPSQELIDLADRAQQLFGLDFTCVDVVETSAGPLVFEVSAFGGFTGLSEACGLNAAKLYADYVAKQLIS